MNIDYLDEKNIPIDELEKLFLSVNWESGKYPEKLGKALQNSQKVFSAWEGEKLVGLISALSDGFMTVYIHYLLVMPEYQGKGIGKKLMNMMLDSCQGYFRIVLIAYDEAKLFYSKCGFESGVGKTAMSMTNLAV